jgi:spore germination cell wall hydrolase CwlJ-like protein
MLSSPRSALLVIAALSASSVAPAQVAPTSGPMVLANNDLPPQLLTPQQLQIDRLAPEQAPIVDDLAPLPDDPANPVKPSAHPSGNLASLVAQLRGSDPGSREVECLAVGIYFEAKSEPLAGQLAVGDVIANRANSNGRFPSSYCGVLFQRGQFSFIRGRALPSVPRASRQWSTAVAVAKIVDRDLKNSAATRALFFHASHVSPGWKLKRIASIGNHVFYR